jgi:hypothetical protein
MENGKVIAEGSGNHVELDAGENSVTIHTDSLKTVKYTARGIEVEEGEYVEDDGETSVEYTSRDFSFPVASGTLATTDDIQLAIDDLDLSNFEELGDRVTTTEDEIDTLQSSVAAINNEETGILANAKTYVDEEDIFETDMTTINALGGIAAGADLNGLTTHEVLKKLLYPYVHATVGNATASPNGGTYEKGTTKTITSVSISVTKKSEPITRVALYNGSTLI